MDNSIANASIASPITGYDAADPRRRRRFKIVNNASEDTVLRSRDRDRLISEARNLRRNASDVAWMIRKHLTYTSTFSFQCRSRDEKVNDRVEELMDWWQRPLNCDVTGRFSLGKIIRVMEGISCTDGDALLMKLSDGKLQIIEGDRIRSPQNIPPELADSYKPDDFVHGVKITPAGKPLSYAICDRDRVTGMYVLSSVVDSQYVYHHGYIERNDQVRGVSPIAAAINTFCDLYENREYALAKAKLSQIIALKLKLKGDPLSAEANEPLQFDFGGGPQTVELTEDEEAEFLETKIPSTEFQSFMEQGTMVALKSLDIPYSFFAENFTNYSGARQALTMYEQSVEDRRKEVRQLLNSLTAWRLALFILDGHLVLPDGWTIDDIKWEYIPIAIPSIDALKEANANGVLLDRTLTSRQQIAQEQGLDWYEIADQQIEEEVYLAKKRAEAGLPPIEAAQTKATAPDYSQLTDDIAQQVADHLGANN